MLSDLSDFRCQEVECSEPPLGLDLPRTVADGAGKYATGLRVEKKRNSRMKETDTKWTAPKALTPNIRSAAKRTIDRKAKDDWLHEWTTTNSGRALYHIMKAPSTAVLKIHNGVERWLSALVVQMRTQKLGLNDFLYHFRVPGIESPHCPCVYGNQTVRHVLMECSYYEELREREHVEKGEEKGGGEGDY